MSMLELIALRGILVPTMVKALYHEIDFTVDSVRANRLFSVCVLTISFMLFLLILTVVYINPDANFSCEFKEITDNVPQLQYPESNTPSHSLTAIKYDEVLRIKDYEDDYSNFLPDVSDLELVDESDIAEEPLYEIQPDPLELPDTRDREAITAVKLASKFKKMNNIEKARKLFQHAMVLSPNQPDVLLHYGEFLESSNDIINADHLYLKALMQRPQNSRALSNRRRTLPRVTQLDSEELKCVEIMRAALVNLNKKDPTLKRLKKEIYFQHIHHTVAIEGNTLTLADTRTIVETRLAVSGKSLLEHNEILGIDSALRFVNQTLAAKSYDITVTDILEIHRRVMGHVDPVTAGTFRKSQVFVGEHTPPAASDVDLLMEEFVELLRSPDITEMNPIHIAAFAHHKLVYIHPFTDGNGRTARLLMNVLFLRYGYPPIIIRKEDRSQYYKYLQIANEGDPRPFYRFIASATKGTIEAYLHAHEFGRARRKALETENYVKDVIPLAV